MTSNSPLLNQFVVATGFIKMHTMPDHRVYAVAQNETVVDGPVSCYTRHKGFFRDVISSVAIRHIVLTKTGYILVWMKTTKGFTLRLSRVCDVTSETSALKYRTGVSWVQQRCVVKMHFPFGTLNVILMNGQIDKWRNALIAGCDKRASAPVPRPRNALVETATDLSLVPPLPPRGRVTSTVVLHPPTGKSTKAIDEWRSSWADVDTITPPSSRPYAPFRYNALKIAIPRSKTFHVTKSTVLSLAGTPLPVATPHSGVPAGAVAVRPTSTSTRGQKAVVVNGKSANAVKRSATIGGEVEVIVPMENERYSAVDRWLRSQIEKRVKRLDGTVLPPDEIESDAAFTPASRPRSRSADANMVSLRSNRRVSRLAGLRPSTRTRRQMAHAPSLSHEGVSCDGCMMPNFSGCRYKCLRCWDFDLCHACYIADRFTVDPAADQVHDRDHPMQCILSAHDFEMFYADDDTRNYATCRIAVLTCPYCNERGFGYAQFYEHVMRNHEEPMPYQVNCPLCIGLVDTESANRVVDNLKQHWTSIHYLYAPTMQVVSTPSSASASDAAIGGGPPTRSEMTRRDRANRLDAVEQAIRDAEAVAAAGGAVPPGPFDLPPTARLERNGARRPMMARRAARQQPGGEVRTERQDRTETREQRQQAAAAAAFGMPWNAESDEVQDLFRFYRLVQRTGGEARAARETPGTDRGRMQRLRNLQATLQQGPGNLIANAEFINRIIGADPGSVPSYAAGLVRGFTAEAAGEYASPRPHGAAVAPRSRTPPVNVIVGLGIRPMTSSPYDHLRHEDGEGTPRRNDSISTLTSGDSDHDLDDSDVPVMEDDDEAEKLAEMIRRTAIRSSSSEEETKDEEEEGPREGVDAERTEEDEMVDALTKQDAIADTTLSQEEIVDMRRATDPFAVRVIDPIKAIRAHATNREWKVIKKLLKNNDLRAKDDGSVSGEGRRRLRRMNEDEDDSDNEIVTEKLGNVRPAGPKDEEDYRNSWFSVKMDTSPLAFARDSYWKDKRFITPRKLDRQQSTATLDEGVLARNALKALSITRTMASGKVLDDTSSLTQGEEMRKTLELWDMQATGRQDESRRREIAMKCDESLLTASRELDFDYDTAMLTALRAEYESLEKELASQVGSPSTAYAKARLAKQKKYLADLRASGAGGSVVLQNPRDDPAEQQELQARLQQLWGKAPRDAVGPEGDQAGPSSRQ